MQLSKSDYMLFLRHPAWLWLKKHDKDKLPPVDNNTQAIFDNGHLFEAYAEQLFPNGLKIGFSNYNEYLNLPIVTKQAFHDGATTIFQGRFEYEQLTCICDVIDVVDELTVDLYEIKSSTKVKPEHEYDLAFQVAVLEGCGFTVRKVAVIHVNNEYVRYGEIEPEKITATTDATENVFALREKTQRYVQQALTVASSRTCPDISPAHCKLSSLKDWLAIYRGLVDLEPGSIYDLCLVGSEKVGKLEALGITRLADIPDDFPLSEKQQRQVRAAKENRVHLEQEAIQSFLSTFQYPLYFLDYETLASIVPYFDGIKPYQQVPFQYSLHILDEPGGELRHVDYLHDQKTNPAASLSEMLKKDLGTEGSIIVWNESFEKSCNELLGSLVEDFADFFQSANDRIVDLMIPFSSGWYVHKDFGGSASIKKVLPVLIPELTYKSLGIQDGGSAQRLWMEAILDGKRDGEKEQILSDLTEYCKLDTLAMVKIFEYLTNMEIVEVLPLPEVVAEVS